MQRMPVIVPMVNDFFDAKTAKVNDSVVRFAKVSGTGMNDDTRFTRDI